MLDHADGAYVTIGDPAAIAAHPSGPADLLLAEELTLLVHGAEDVPWLGSAFGTCLAGALIAELATRGRLVVEPSAELRALTIRVVDATRTGDDLLDDALRALDAPSPPSPRAPAWMMGAVDLLRIRRRGTVQDSDLCSWWNGYWSTSQVGPVAPTLLCRLLTVHECVNTVMRRVNDRLAARGLVEFHRWGRHWTERGDRWCSGYVETHVCDSVLERWARVASAAASDNDGASYLAALDVPELGAVKDCVADRRSGASGCHGELGAVVSQVVTGWRTRREYGC